MPTYKFSFHPSIIDKSDSAGLAASGKGWVAADFTAQELAVSIGLGRAYAPLYRDGRRKTSNFVCAGFLAADIDRDMSLDEARGHAFVQHHAALIHTTASHTPERHRFRIIHLLDEPITSAQDWADAQRGLALKYNSDPSVADGGRMFYGNTAAEIFHIGETMPPTVVADLIARGRDARATLAPGGGKLPVESVRRVAGPEMVKTAGGTKTRLDELGIGVKIHCPYHDDGDPSAFTLASRTGKLGIHCSACKVTFWSSDGEDGYDFDAFDRLFLRLQAGQEVIDPDARGFDRFFPPAPRFVKHQERFLPAIPYEPGITLIKSPKGSGKTEALKAIVDAVRQGLFLATIARKERPRSILLVGHRQSLLREAAKKLGLRCYLDGEDESADASVRTLAVTLDSLPKYNESKDRSDKVEPFDLVIIDESEQVLGHLFGETIKKGRGIERCFDALKFEVENAKAVIALDADLGLVTTQALRTMRPQDWHSRCRIIYNSPVVSAEKRVMRLHRKKPFLERELVRAIKRGEKCFVVSNSKKYIDTLDKLIVTECGDGIVMRVITSDNSRDPATIKFLANITTEFLKVQVVLGTPSIGTGIDITFPFGECKVDRVFGFFYPFVNTHTDIDQQLARVRNPGQVDVWISPATFSFTCNVETVMDDLARAYVVPRAVTGRRPDGMVEYDRGNPLLMICTHVTALRRASKNRLVELFCALREANGWAVEEVAESAPSGPYEAARKALALERSEMLIGAPKMDDADFIELEDRVKKGATLSKEERAKYERNYFEREVGMPLDGELVDLNADGKLLQKIKRLAVLVRRWKESESFDGNLTLSLEAASQPNGRLEAPKTPEYLTAVLARAAGLMSGTGFNQDTRVSVGGLARFVDLCGKNRTMIEEVFGEPLRDDFAKKPVRQLNLFLKRIGLVLARTETKKIAGQKVRFYVVSGDRSSMMLRLAESYVEGDPRRREASEEAALEFWRRSKRFEADLKQEPAAQAQPDLLSWPDSE